MDREQLKKSIDSGNNHDINLLLSKHKNTILNDLRNSTKPNKEPIRNDKQNKLNLKYKSIETYVSESSIHGLGVFAKENIPANKIIEICYIIELKFRDKYHKDETVLNYCYTFHKNDSETLIHGNKLIMITGNGMLYNHSQPPNAFWKTIEDDRKIFLISSTEILADTEITIDYGNGYWSRINAS